MASVRSPRAGAVGSFAAHGLSSCSITSWYHSLRVRGMLNGVWAGCSIYFSSRLWWLKQVSAKKPQQHTHARRGVNILQTPDLRSTTPARQHYRSRNKPVPCMDSSLTNSSRPRSARSCAQEWTRTTSATASQTGIARGRTKKRTGKTSAHAPRRRRAAMALRTSPAATSASATLDMVPVAASPSLHRADRLDRDRTLSRTSVCSLPGCPRSRSTASRTTKVLAIGIVGASRIHQQAHHQSPV